MTNSENKPCILVTAVGAPPGLNTLRFLLESNKYQLIAADASADELGLLLYANKGVKSILLPKAANESEYIEELIKLKKRNNVSAVIACIENEVLVLSKYQHELAQNGISVLLPEPKVLKKASSKFKSTLIAKKIGLQCPESISITCPVKDVDKFDLIESFATQIGFPLILKPTIGYGMKGVKDIVSLDDLRQSIKQPLGEMILQEKIPGKQGSMHLAALLYDTNGNVVRRFASRSFRTLFPTGGPATAGVSIKNSMMIEQTEHLLLHCGGWRGPAAVEWMLDPRDNQLKYIEVNPRLWGYSSLAAGSGTRFHENLADLSLGKDIGEDPGYKEGTIMIRTTYDEILDECPETLNIPQL